MEREATVFVVDDDEAVRSSLKWLIESAGFGVETWGTAQEFLSAFNPNRHGCIVLDIRLPGMSGLELQQKLSGSGVQMPVIIITGHGDVPTAVRAMKNGAVELLEKPINDAVLLGKIREALEQDSKTRRQAQQDEAVETRISSLTLREKQVMDLVVAGRANKQIAQHLGITKKTVEAHRARVMRKMNAPTLADLVRTVTNHDTPDGQSSGN